MKLCGKKIEHGDYQSHLYESGNPIISYVAKLRIDRILDKIRPEDFVLDAGCGEGYTTSAFAKKCKRIVGVDIVPARTKKAGQIAKSNGVLDKTKFVCSDLFQVRKAISENFDTVVCSEVIEHVENPKELLEILAAMVNQSGQLIITYPNEDVLRLGRKIFFLGKAKRIEDMTAHKTSLGRKDVEGFAKELGLKIVYYEKIPRFPLVYLNELFVLKKLRE